MGHAVQKNFECRLFVQNFIEINRLKHFTVSNKFLWSVPVKFLSSVQPMFLLQWMDSFQCYQWIHISTWQYDATGICDHILQINHYDISWQTLEH